MMGATAKHLSAGTRVKVIEPMSVPTDSAWDDDGQRTSTPVKKRLQQLFFKGDRRVQASIVYVASESVRAMLKRKNQFKVELRDPAGSSVVITAGTDVIRAA